MDEISVPGTYPDSNVKRLKPRVLLVDDQMTIAQIVRAMYCMHRELPRAFQPTQLPGTMIKC